eukprot:1313185-Rhodomonas_salina.1
MHPSPRFKKRLTRQNSAPALQSEEPLPGYLAGAPAVKPEIGYTGTRVHVYARIDGYLDQYPRSPPSMIIRFIGESGATDEIPECSDTRAVVDHRTYWSCYSVSVSYTHLRAHETEADL